MRPPPPSCARSARVRGAARGRRYHDGVNYMRAVCVLVLHKARGYFEASLSKLRLRLLHVMGRMVDPIDGLLRAEAEAAWDLSRDRMGGMGGVGP
eukprot:6328152-Prymnesium_polylepis.1